VIDPVSSVIGRLSAAVVWLLVAPLRLYRRFVSPYLPPVCRFHPSCSAYAIEALQVHGPVLGGWLTVRRLLRCAPWHPGGYDPVPAPGRPVVDTTAEETISC
jgi:uncharacterized protein